MATDDWTAMNGQANSSYAYEAAVQVVEHVLLSHRLGDSAYQTARLIISKLAHQYDFAPRSELGLAHAGRDEA